MDGLQIFVEEKLLHTQILIVRGDDVMVVNTKCGWTADPRLHTITDLKSESADGRGLIIIFSAHRIND